MGKYKKYKNIVEQFLSGEKGQRFFNFAYSIGAAIVIWGALFKILHLPGGNALLSIGMGTEVLMFILTAFDRPPREYHWEEVFPVFKTKNPEDRPDFKGGGSVVVGGAPVSAGQPVQGEAMGVVGGGVAGAVPSGEVTAQYCRLPYTMVDATGTEIVTHKHLLSLKDMNRSDQLEALLDAGVSSLKIEGRLKDVGYVKNITAYYRKKLDAVLSRRPEYRRASAGRSTYTFEPVAEKSFNRGFTPFLLEGRTADITAFNTPKSLGEPVGTVKEIKGNSFTVAGLKQLSNGDGLVFFNRKGELEGFRVNRVEANRVFPLDMPQLTPKTPLYRNFDQAFDKLLAKPSAERKLSVEIEFLDNPFGFTLCMEDETGARIMLTEPFAKELARRERQDNIRTQLSKLGNTPFEASKVVVGLSENWFVPSSLLADMRRRGVEKLLEARRARYPRETVKRVQPSVSIPFPERQLTYLGNVANGKARSFYQDHGVEQIDPAFELSPRKDVPLMFTKHCLRYSMGWCPTYQKDKSPYKEPYYLLYKDTRLRLQFDCKHCQMLVFES